MPSLALHAKIAALLDEAAQLVKKKHPTWVQPRRALGAGLAQLVMSRGIVRPKTMSAWDLFEALVSVGLAVEHRKGQFVATDLGYGYRPTDSERRDAREAIEDVPGHALPKKPKKGQAASRARVMSVPQFEQELGWPKGSAWPRMKALDLLEVCSRCGGSGRYSFNLTDLDTCYGCRGNQMTLPSLTPRLVERVRELVARGALEPYFKEIERRKAAARLIGPLVARASALSDRGWAMVKALRKPRDDAESANQRMRRQWREAEIPFEQREQLDRTLPAVPAVPAYVRRMADMLHDLQWGRRAGTPPHESQSIRTRKGHRIPKPAVAGWTEIETYYKDGEYSSVEAVPVLEERIAQLEELVASMEVHVAKNRAPGLAASKSTAWVVWVEAGGAAMQEIARAKKLETAMAFAKRYAKRHGWPLPAFKKEVMASGRTQYVTGDGDIIVIEI